MKKYLFPGLFLALLFVVGVAFAPTQRPAATASGIQWVTAEEAFKKTAGDPNNQKFVFIHVTTSWCGWCRKMENDTYSQKEVYDYLNQHFYSVSFDAEQKEDLKIGDKTFSFQASGGRGYHQFAAEITQGKLSYPTLVLLGPTFNLIQPIPGYKNKDDLMQILRFFGDKHYTRIDWNKYQQEYPKLYPKS
jgi:thioredoxin-related protein